MTLSTHAFVLGTALCAGPLLSLTASTPAPGGIALVIAPPSVSVETLVVQSGGRIIGPFSGVFGTLALSDDPDFANDLRANGAWAVADGTLISRFCGVTI